MSQTIVEPEPPLHSELLAGYPRGGGHFDTAFSAGGQWRVIFDLTLGFGRDFGDGSPIRGRLAGGGRHDGKVAVNVSVL